jgi:acyl-CoA synthetase (AMP-forming)/AMP-acid ligase II
MGTPHTPDLVEMLWARAAAQPERRAFAFLGEGTAETEALPYGELDARARAIAVALAERGARGERVLLLYPPGLEFIAAFFGCLYAGAVAVPSYPPRPHRDQPRLRAIARDCRPAFALGSRAVVERSAALVDRVPEMAGTVWMATEDLDPAIGELWTAPAVGPAGGSTAPATWRGARPAATSNTSGAPTPR